MSRTVVRGERITPTVRTFSTVKQGYEESENEDACAADPVSLRFAVADGASTAARSDVWSRLLVEAFVHEHLDPTDPGTRRELSSRWLAAVWRADLAWFAQEKLSGGSAATFVGLTFSDETYRVHAVGDSCLFHLRGDRVLLAGPMFDPDEFDRFPELLRTSSESRGGDAVWEAVGTHLSGDVFVLATDAVAATFLTACSTEGRVPAHYVDTPSELVDRARNEGRNDDMTMCVIEI
ncbi:protein phosphatase 2C domain-containing protein [Saccharopolyspora sp. NPDC047091]|uniref:protein phosphatase 2C domain-containing protein n=1 Tax=Saccharopolyspora sp. NPDC047091 TaxID=3155924 RepID=UPI0033DC55E1